MKKIEKATIITDSGNVAQRWLYEDEFGLCFKHCGKIVSVKPVAENGTEYEATSSTMKVWNARNN